MDIISLLLVGLLAGILASVIVGGIGYGIIGDIAVGILGAFLGTYIFVNTGWRAPFHGMASEIAVATVGSVILLVVLHLFQHARRRRLT